jgi:hypothetical protein
MLAGGMVIAAPSMVPQAMAANETLFVSAENSLFDNTFSGPQVVEIVVSDPLLSSLDEVHGSPDVTVNGKDVLMAQASDGSWYAYITDVTYSDTAAKKGWTHNQGITHGAECNMTGAATSISGSTFSDATSVFFPVENTTVVLGGYGTTTGTAGTACSLSGNTWATAGDLQNVVKGAKALSNNSTVKSIGQIFLEDADLFPFIQAYTFTETGDVVIEYNKAGANESVTLKFDETVTYQTIDRTSVPNNADIMLEIGDPSLNIDPTAEDRWIFKADGTAYYMDATSAGPAVGTTLMFGEADLAFTAMANSKTVIDTRTNADTGSGVMLEDDFIGVFETGANTAIFTSYDDADKSTIFVHADTTRGQSGKIDYSAAASIIVTMDFAEFSTDLASIGDEWNSGEALTVTLTDNDLNLNTRADEDLDVNSTTLSLVPTLQIGSPLSLVTGGSITTNATSGSNATTVVVGSAAAVDTTVPAAGGASAGTSFTIDSYSKIARHVSAAAATSSTLGIYTNMKAVDLNTLVNKGGSEYLSIDLRNIIGSGAEISAMYITEANSATIYGTVSIGTSGSGNGQQINAFTPTTASLSSASSTDEVAITVLIDGSVAGTSISGAYAIDFMTFADSVNHSIYRMELEETGDNTSTFEGTVEYVMSNQVNMNNSANIATTVGTLDFFDDNIIMLLTSSASDEDAPRVNYLDLGADGVSTQIAIQQDAPTHSGVADLDLDTYKVADTVVITITDMDLNVDDELIDVYEVQSADADGTASDVLLFSVTFDDNEWAELDAQNLTLVETDVGTGVFVGSFQIPKFYTGTTTTTGTDIEVNYMDHRDASDVSIEVGDGAGVRANTGSVSLDRTVYPVPWGDVNDYSTTTPTTTPNSLSLFPIHASGLNGNITKDYETISNGAGDLTIHVRVNDPDLDLSAVGEDKMNTNRGTGTSALTGAVGPLKVSITRGTDEITLAYAGGATSSTDKRIVVGSSFTNSARTLGPITEVSGDSGIFELDLTIKNTDGPASSVCPKTDVFVNLDGAGTAELDRFDTAAPTNKEYCILQGDILTVEYLDNTDASGNKNTVTDSATFDLRNGVLQSDKSVYIIGSDMIITIIEPDWDLNNDSSETYDLDVIEWDSDAAAGTMGNSITNGMSSETSNGSFDPEPSSFRETGDSTGIFQVVFEIPASLNGNNLERGEQIDLEYTDWGPAGSDYVGQEDEDINVTVYTSNFGATVELDQKVYTWTDKVYITIVAPDHNMDSNLVDTIGDTANDSVKITTRSYDVNRYSLVESGTDTGIFTGEITLTGFSHAADGTNTHTPTSTSADSTGPTDGYLETSSDDGLTVSFEYSEDSTVVGSALIRWNIGEVQWLEASYPASGTGVVRVIDPDMNLNPEAVDNFDVEAWSDSDAGGINLTITETNEATGIFEGTVFFTVDNASSGHRLRVSEGDTVTVSYEDNTLPDPYTTADELDVTATTLIGTVVPPLERAPAANLRTVDAFGNSLDAVSIDQQVQLTADLSNGQDKDQPFAYLVQVQNENGVTVSLAWITGSLSAGQSFSPALSWIPTEAGSFTATAFVWESVDNPTALSPSVSTTVNVR